MTITELDEACLEQYESRATETRTVELSVEELDRYITGGTICWSLYQPRVIPPDARVTSIVNKVTGENMPVTYSEDRRAFVTIAPYLQ